MLRHDAGRLPPADRPARRDGPDRYRTLLAPPADPHGDTRDPRWATERVIGPADVLARYGRPRFPHGETGPHDVYTR